MLRLLDPPNILVIALALLLRAPALPAQGGASTPEEVEASLEEFESLYKNRNAHVRKAAVEGLSEARLDHYLIMEAYLQVLRDPEDAVRKAAVVGLSTQHSTEAVARMIQRMWRGRDPKIRLAVLEAFRTSQPKVAFSAIQDLCDYKDWEIRAAAAETLSYYPDNEEGATAGTLIPMIQDKEPLVRLAVMDALCRLANRRANQPAIAALEDKDWRVRAAAVQVLVKLRQKSAVQPLIDTMRREDGRLRDDCAAALEKLTGSDWDVDPDQWQKWWDRNQEHFKIPSLRELRERKKKAEEPTGYARPKTEYPPYHGIKTRSRRIVFLLDISNSMTEKVTLDERETRYVEEFRRRYGDSRVKIDIAREELINVIAGLKPYVRFNIILFNAEVKKWKKNLLPATPGNRNQAIRFLAKLTVQQLVPTGGKGRRVAVVPGQTNTFEALNALYNLTRESDQSSRGYETEADTAFLLSDGNPTAGRIVQPEMLLRYFRTINKRAKIVVHTISFGRSNRHLMEPLATESGGQYVTLGN